MKHYLITRFNLPSISWKRTSRGEKTLTKEWHQHRYKIFENFCFPSVVNQSNQNFSWLVFFDSSTSQKYRVINTNFGERYKNLRVIYIDGMSALLLKIQEIIKQENQNRDEYVITTRLDNDDLIHRDFIQTIQNNFIPKDKTVIDLRAGYQFILTNKTIKAREYDLAFNSFISLIEKADESKSVLSKRHMQWKNNNDQVVYNRIALWASLIHRKNILNTEIQNLVKTENIRFDDFGITGELSKSVLIHDKHQVFSQYQQLKKLLAILGKALKAKK